jgi:hypothetical protein
MANPEKHVCGRDCDYDADRGCPVGDAVDAPGWWTTNEDPDGPGGVFLRALKASEESLFGQIDAELARIESKIEYLERRDGIR